MNKFKDVAWAQISWAEVRSNVQRLQKRIYKARRENTISRVHWLQRLMITSYDAKLYSVLQVTTLHTGRATAGIDKFVPTTDQQKIKLARGLSINGRASPVKRVWIPKPGKTEERPLGIPTIHDRAKQALCKLALEPEWEAIFEPNSYGFRPGRRTHDAVEAIFSALHHKTPKYIFEAEITKCFDRINHQALLDKLNTFPLFERQIKSWLRAGILDEYSKANKDKDDILTPTTMGTTQGGVLSPLLANIALHGLENHIKEKILDLDFVLQSRGKAAKRKSVSVIRYADDFVITHQNLEILNQLVNFTKEWLTGVGLEISEEKSRVTDSRQGFLFLGFQFIMIQTNGRYRTQITPSRKNQAKLLLTIRQKIQKGKSLSSYQLIAQLSPIVLGWANYYKTCECAETFSSVNHKILNKLRAWAFRKNPRASRTDLKEKYFPSGRRYTFQGKKHSDNWILVGSKVNAKGKLVENYLPHMQWVSSVKHVKIRGDMSPYNSDNMYWTKRAEKHSTYSIRQQKLLKEQDFKCALCGQIFNSFDRLKIDHIQPVSKGGIDDFYNLQIVHRECHVKKTQTDLSKTYESIHCRSRMR